MYIADYISSTPFISETDLILLSTRPRIALRWHQRRILREYETQIQNHYHDNYLAQLATFNSRKSDLEIWNDVPAVAAFITEQIMTLETTCYLELDLHPGLYSAKELLITIYRAYAQLRRDLFVKKPPKYVSASRKLEAFVLLNANVLAWLDSKPEIITKTIELSVRNDQNYEISERASLDNYQTQLQKHHSRIIRSQLSIYDILAGNLKQCYDDLTLKEFVQVRAMIADCEGQLSIPESSYLQGPVTELVRLIRDRAHNDLFVRKPPRYTYIDLMQRIIALINEALPAYGFPFRISEEPVAGHCAICTDEFGNEDTKQEDSSPLHDLRGEATPVSKDDVAVLRCGHVYHVGCALKWYNQWKAIPPNCPLCREPFLSSEKGLC